jgi:hypothetical protein
MKQIIQQGTYYFGEITTEFYCCKRIYIRYLHSNFFDIGDYVLVDENNPISLKAPIFDNNTQFLWSTGATENTISVSTHGEYWFKATDHCGVINSDTINIYPYVAEDSLFYTGQLNENYMLVNDTPSIYVSDYAHWCSNSLFNIDINADGQDDYRIETQTGYANGGGGGSCWLSCLNNNEICVDASGKFACVMQTYQIIDSALNWSNNKVYLKTSSFTCENVSDYEEPYWNNQNFGYMALHIVNNENTEDCYAYLQLKIYPHLFRIYGYIIKDYSHNGSQNQSIGELTNNLDIGIYPNPATDILNIELNISTEYQLSIFDISGKLLYTQQSNNKQLKVDLSHYSPGIYLVKIFTSNGVKTQKFIVD